MPDPRIPDRKKRDTRNTRGDMAKHLFSIFPWMHDTTHHIARPTKSFAVVRGVRVLAARHRPAKDSLCGGVVRASRSRVRSQPRRRDTLCAREAKQHCRYCYNCAIQLVDSVSQGKEGPKHKTHFGRKYLCRVYVQPAALADYVYTYIYIIAVVKSLILSSFFRQEHILLARFF